MLTVRNSTTGCVSAIQNFIVHVISCTAPYMTWVPLPEGSVHGSCVSATACNSNTVCYGLQYTPNITGTLTSYTTGFFIDCSTNGNPVVSNTSCVMTNNSPVADSCATLSLVKINSSGNSGSIMVTQNVPIIIHQVCLTIPMSESLNIVEDEATNLTTSIDLTGGGFVSEEPGYTTYTVSSDLECVTLPLWWLQFQASRYDELMAQLDWTTTDEINNSHFEIQRSNDNGRNFLTIGRVDAVSRDQAINSYQFIDLKAMAGKNYYRLKQVDFDGKYDFSPVRTVTFTSGAFSVKAWPNPASTEVTISINHADDSGKIILVDITGKQLVNKDFERGASDHELVVEDLQPGMYTLVVISGNNSYVEKIVIMD